MKKNRTIILAAVVVALAVVVGRADARRIGGDVRDIVKKVKSTYAATRSAVIKFEQTGAGGRAAGTLTYAPGDKYRLELPRQTMISDGARVWTYTPEKKQVVVSKASKASGRLTPEDILTSFPGDYTPELTGESTVNGRPVWVVRCTPGSGRKIGDVTKATLYVDKGTYRFQQIDIESPSIGRMSVRIVNAQYGKTGPDSQFTFAAPKDVRVIDLSK